MVVGERRLAAAVLLLGLVVIALAQAGGRAARPPLYDGVVPAERYRWLSPPPGEHGGAEGASGTVAVTTNSSPLVAIATPEEPPQAQVFAGPETLNLPPATTSLTMSITPVPPSVEPTSGHFAGNVYRISIASQTGQPVTAPPEGLVSVALRSAEPVTVTINQLVAGRWKPLETSTAGFGGVYLAVVTEFGDFAPIAKGAAPSTTPPAASETSLPESPEPSVEPEQPSAGAPVPPVAVLIAGVVLLGSAVIVAVWRPRSRRAGKGFGPGPRPRR